VGRPRLLDLFCGEGGASAGYVQAGFDVVGVDVLEMVRYPFTFRRGDAMTWSLKGFDAVHASPPCHDHSTLAGFREPHGTGWMLGATLERLAESGLPYVVENVLAGELAGSLKLCGTEFGLGARTRDGRWRSLRRHRLFGSSVFLMGAGRCNCYGKKIIGVYGNGGGVSLDTGFAGVKSEMAEAMEMPWASVAGLSQAIPPAYTRFIGEQLMASLK
jgi:DNA (cytosine-5)-methyltransferase 1